TPPVGAHQEVDAQLQRLAPRVVRGDARHDDDRVAAPPGTNPAGQRERIVFGRLEGPADSNQQAVETFVTKQREGLAGGRNPVEARPPATPPGGPPGPRTAP